MVSLVNISVLNVGFRCSLKQLLVVKQHRYACLSYDNKHIRQARKRTLDDYEPYAAMEFCAKQIVFSMAS